MADTANRQQDGKSGNDDDSDSDAEMEEEAGREIQKARYATMDEDDFLPDGVAAPPSLPSKTTTKTKTSQSPATTSKRSVKRSLTREETMEQLERDNPEFLPLVQHFSRVGVQELTERLLIVSKQLSDWKQAQVSSAFKSHTKREKRVHFCMGMDIVICRIGRLNPGLVDKRERERLRIGCVCVLYSCYFGCGRLNGSL